MATSNRLLLTAACAFVSGVLASCAEPTVSKSADPTRAMTPVPSCVRLLPRRAATGFARQLPEKDYWGLVIPSFAEGITATSAETLACNGERVFDAPPFEGATFEPKALDDGRISYGGGANRLRVLWLRSHNAGETEQAGPLALVRVLEEHAEVYGVGAYRGNSEKSRFGLERLGGDLVVTAVSDGCSGSTGDCDTSLIVFLPVAGRLTPLAAVWLERVRYTSGLEKGVSGTLKFRMVSSPAFQKDGVHVVEEVTVTDESGRKLRRAEIERIFRMKDSTLGPDSESLWDRLYESRVLSARAKKSIDDDVTKAPSPVERDGDQKVPAAPPCTKDCPP